jgi:hypothetical protein
MDRLSECLVGAGRKDDGGMLLQYSWGVSLYNISSKLTHAACFNGDGPNRIRNAGRRHRAFNVFERSEREGWLLQAEKYRNPTV